jgi:Glycine zipper
MDVKKFAIIGGMLAAFATSGCEHMSNTAKGGLIGGGVGAGLGSIAGGGKGALVGGLIGTAAGGLIGNDMDQQEKRDTENRLAIAESKAAANTLPPPVPASSAPLGMADVIQMSRDGMSDTMIINQIHHTNSTFQLSVEDLRLLQANHVTQPVIEEMQRRRPVTRVIREQPQVIYHERPAPVYVYPAPPPRPYPPGGYVGVGVYAR